MRQGIDEIIKETNSEKMSNHMNVCFDGISSNESVARMIVAGFVSLMNPTLDELQDVKTAVSEAVTNCIVHGYENKRGNIEMDLSIVGNELTVAIRDYGVGISDVNKAREPLFTTKPDEERCGMGFMFMDAFMDNVDVESKVGIGTTITMKKYIGKEI